ncbi:hypothetical protein N7504_005379 [Penicillium tannophilum]|nr:hypothetical protein N7504_005379 [Penicillium tannophilum]
MDLGLIFSERIVRYCHLPFRHSSLFKGSSLTVKPSGSSFTSRKIQMTGIVSSMIESMFVSILFAPQKQGYSSKKGLVNANYGQHFNVQHLSAKELANESHCLIADFLALEHLSIPAAVWQKS